MKRITFAAIALTVMALPALAAQSAYDRGMSIGKKRGYPNPECYAKVFASYAQQDTKGVYQGPGGRAAAAYKQELSSTCGISR